MIRRRAFLLPIFAVHWYDPHDRSVPPLALSRS